MVSEKQDSSKADNSVLYNPPMYVHPRSKDYDSGPLKIHWGYMLLWSVILVVISALLFITLFDACAALNAVQGANSIIFIAPFNLFILGIFAIIGLFVSGLIYILGYFSSPFFISEIGGRHISTESLKSRDRAKWSYALYPHLKNGDRRSKAAFCFTYMLPYMSMYGGFFFMLGIVFNLSGFTGSNVFIITCLGFSIWFFLAAVGFIVGPFLMNVMVRRGIITGQEPLPTPRDFFLSQ